MRLSLTLASAALVLAACDRQGAPVVAPSAASERAIEALPRGDLAGGVESTLGADIRNPLEGQASAVAAGKQLFMQMNCAGCHGYDLGGSMGPNLTDKYWRYGGSPGAIYRSIADGHPQGMPAWRRALPPGQIWQLTAYIQSFGGATSPADYPGGLQGDEAAKPTGKGAGTGAESGAKGASSPAAQSPNP
jgi:cytochrome c oxidase cbb3-type subunit 3